MRPASVRRQIWLTSMLVLPSCLMLELSRPETQKAKLCVFEVRSFVANCVFY